MSNKEKEIIFKMISNKNISIDDILYKLNNDNDNDINSNIHRLTDIYLEYNLK